MAILKKLKDYRFEIRHFIILFIILATFQIILSYLYKASSKNLVEQTMDLYRKDSAIRLANLTTTSLELLLEQTLVNPAKTEEAHKNIIQAFDIILNQQTLQQNVDELCLIFTSQGKTFAIDEGIWLYNFIFNHEIPEGPDKWFYNEAIHRYQRIAREIEDTEQIFCDWDNIQSFHVLVPLVLKGEYEGVVYMKISPDVSNITREISSVYDETGIIFTALILFGLLAMFYLTSYTVKERDLAQELLFKEREQQIKKDIAHQKEELFTKRIYHAHHKAEKIMGFIKDELRQLTDKNIAQFKYIVNRYANFISRVIYDMKWYEPPVHTIRNQLFNTDINKVIEFLLEYLFKRVYSEHTAFVFDLKLDKKLPKVHINEYVIWEILEPLIQNSIDHNKGKNITITIRTEYHESENYSEIAIMDNGEGISPELLDRNEEGIKNIFLEHTSTSVNTKNSGYGCYIAYELSTKRCGWTLDAVNLASGGCALIVKIPINN
jgi:signal transduction histidine kinase